MVIKIVWNRTQNTEIHPYSFWSLDFNKNAGKFNGERRILLTNGAGTTGYTYATNKKPLRYLTSYTTIN